VRLFFDESLSVGWVTGAIRPPRLSGSFFVKATYALRHDARPELLEEAEVVRGDLRVGDHPAGEIRYPSDFVPLKPKADVMLVGTAHCPGGSERRELRVRMRVGQLSKELAVRGRRSFKRQMLSLSGSVVSTPEPFTSVPMDWAHAFGGPKSKRNPVGMGHGTQELPMVVHADAPVIELSTKQAPAGYGPVAPEWEQRSALAGTYKRSWGENRWPWFPEDFDYGYFNAAPEDQQVPYLRGDEELLIDNLHARHRRFRSRLPGQRARLFLTDPGGFREVPLNLDTLWIDMDEERIVLVWRGIAEVASLKLKEIDRLFALLEPLSEADHDIEHYRALEQEHERAIEAGDEDPRAAARLAEVEADVEKAEAELAERSARLEAEAEKEIAEAEARAATLAEEQLRAGGIDPAGFGNAPEPDWTEAVAALRAEHGDLVPEIDVKGLAALEAGLAAEQEPVAEPPSKEQVEAAVAEGRSLAEHDFSERDLSGLHLEGADLRGANLARADLQGSRLGSSNLSGADLGGANLAGADLSHAKLDGADLTGAALEGADLRFVSLDEAYLPELDLAGANFSGAHGVACDFSGSDLTGARFVQAEFEQADFTGCRLADADFSAARLRAAQFEETVARGIRMEGAEIEGLHASDGSNFAGGNFRRAQGPGAVWCESTLDGADFTGARLDGSDFADCSLKGAVFRRASLVGVDFDDADLAEADLRQANLLRASFDRTELAKADLRGANAYGAGFWESRTGKTKLDGTNLKGTSLG
jgi:uncharacterized protein YjbI with pentapeptide repeats